MYLRKTVEDICIFNCFCLWGISDSLERCLATRFTYISLNVMIGVSEANVPSMPVAQRHICQSQMA